MANGHCYRQRHTIGSVNNTSNSGGRNYKHKFDPQGWVQNWQELRNITEIANRYMGYHVKTMYWNGGNILWHICKYIYV